MSREWQQTRYPELMMPEAVYYQTVWAVRDLERMELRLREIKQEESLLKGKSIVRDTRCRNKMYQPVEDYAVERVILEERIRGIRKALDIVPQEHQVFILDNIVFKAPGKSYPCKNWGYWKQRFLYNVAKNLSLI